MQIHLFNSTKIYRVDKGCSGYFVQIRVPVSMIVKDIVSNAELDEIRKLLDSMEIVEKGHIELGLGEDFTEKASINYSFYNIEHRITDFFPNVNRFTLYCSNTEFLEMSQPQGIGQVLDYSIFLNISKIRLTNRTFKDELTEVIIKKMISKMSKAFLKKVKQSIMDSYLKLDGNLVVSCALNSIKSAFTVE